MKFKTQLKIAGLFVLTLLLTLFTLKTQVKANLTQFPFYWDSIAVAIDVADNGDMLVTETQKYVFNQEYSNNRYRYIPLDRVDDITDVTVSENNRIIPSDTGRESDRLWIRWQHELNPPESHTFVLKYLVIGGLQVSKNTQVYWNAIFSDRLAPIQNAKVTVKLPKSLAGKINSYTHETEGTSVLDRQLDERTIEFVTQKPIPKAAGLKVKVAFPNDILNMSKSEWQKNRLLKSIKNIRLPWLGVILAILWPAISMIFGIESIGSSSTHYGDSGSCSGDSGGDAGGGGGGG